MQTRRFPRSQIEAYGPYGDGRFPFRGTWNEKSNKWHVIVTVVAVALIGVVLSWRG